MKSEITLFVSYSEKDEDYARQLGTLLKVYQRDERIRFWEHSDLLPERDALIEVEEELQSADIVVILLSNWYVASDYLYSSHMLKALERQEKKLTRVVFIHIRPFFRSSTEASAKSLYLPRNGKPLTQWADIDAAFVDVMHGLDQIIKNVSRTLTIAPVERDVTPESVLKELPAATTAFALGDTDEFRRILSDYYQAHAHQRLSIQARPNQIIYFNHRFVELVSAWQYWRFITANIRDKRVVSIYKVKKIVYELVDILCNQLNGDNNWQFLHEDERFLVLAIPINMRLVAPTEYKEVKAVFFFGSTLENAHIMELRSLIQKPHEDRFFLLFLFFDEQKWRKGVVRIKEALDAYAYDVVPVDLLDFLHIIGEEDVKKAFRRHMLSHMNLHLDTPFVTQGPTPSHMFFGRENELRLIEQNIANKSYAIIGGRRIGKTSILNRLQSELNVGQPPFFVDCSSFQTIDDFKKYVSREYAGSSPDAQPLSPDLSLYEVLETITQYRTAWLMDEFDKLIPIDKQNEYVLSNTLRTLSQNGRGQFIVSGEYTLRQEILDSRSPMYNFLEPLTIKNLEYSATRELILSPLRDIEISIWDQELLVEQIWRLTGGHPNVTQRFCYRLVKLLNARLRRSINPKDFEIVSNDTEFLRTDFLDTYWERATWLEKLCTLVMAKDDMIRTLAAIRTEFSLLPLQPYLPSLNEIQAALDKLVDLRNILMYRDNTSYAFAIESFPKVLQQHFSIDGLISLYCERYKMERARSN